MHKMFKLGSMLLLLAAMLVFSSTCLAAKKIVAVMGVENSVGNNWGERAAQDLESQLTAALVQSGRYDVVERTQLEYLMRELGLHSSGLISGKTAIQFGQLSGAEYTVIGNVTAASVEPFNNYLYRGHKGKIKFNFKFIDNKTGVIKVAEIIEGSDTVSEFENTRPNFNTLISGAANDVSEKIVDLINDANPIVGVVAGVSGENIYIDLGFDNGAHEDDKFIVYREGNVITHPVTGEIIGVEEEELGVAKIIDAKSNYSICKVTKSERPIRKGDKVKREKS